LRAGDQISSDSQQDKNNSEGEDDARHVHGVEEYGTPLTMPRQ